MKAQASLSHSGSGIAFTVATPQDDVHTVTNRVIKKEAPEHAATTEDEYDFHRRLTAAAEKSPPILWMAPALAGGGYSSEALTFAQGLASLMRRRFKLRQFAEHMDDGYARGAAEAGCTLGAH